MAQKDPKGKWQPAIVKTEISPRSYLITDNNDRVLRLNRSHLLHMKVPELTSTNSETRSTRTSGNTDPNSSNTKLKVKDKLPSRRRQATRPSEPDLSLRGMNEQ